MILKKKLPGCRERPARVGYFEASAFNLRFAGRIFSTCGTISPAEEFLAYSFKLFLPKRKPVVEQILTSIAIVPLDISLYLVVFAKKGIKNTLLTLIISLASISILFLINFNPDIVSSSDNFILLGTVTGALIFYIMSLFGRFMTSNMLSRIERKTQRKLSDSFVNLSLGVHQFFSTLVLIFIIFAQLSIIWKFIP